MLVDCVTIQKEQPKSVLSTDRRHVIHQRLKTGFKSDCQVIHSSLSPLKHGRIRKINGGMSTYYTSYNKPIRRLVASSCLKDDCALLLFTHTFVSMAARPHEYIPLPRDDGGSQDILYSSSLGHPKFPAAHSRVFLLYLIIVMQTLVIVVLGSRLSSSWSSSSCPATCRNPLVYCTHS